MAKRVQNVAPLCGDFAVLWLHEVAHIPLGIFMIGVGLTCTASVALAITPALAQIAPARTLSEDAILVVLGAVLAASFGFLAWALIDRLGWARKDERIASQGKRLDEHDRKIEEIQRDMRGMPSKDDYIEFKESLLSGQAMTQDMIRDLADKLYKLAAYNGRQPKG
jgi:hypothetical protein